MKFSADRDSLIQALNIALRGISSRTTLPILKGILIKCDIGEKKVRFNSSDLEISIDTSIEADTSEGGSIVVSAKLLVEVIRKLPPGLVDITVEEELSRIIIHSGSIEDVLQGIPADEFPVFESREGGESFSFDSVLFKEMIRRTAFAASIEEARGIITGVLFELSADEARMVALDGFRMAIVKEEIKGNEERSIIVSARIMNDISRIITDAGVDEDILVRVKENMVYFIIGDTTVFVRLMEGDFIKYRDILPKEKSLQVCVGRELLLESVDRASVLVREGKNAFVRLKVEDGQLTITSRADEGNYLEMIPVEQEGGNLEIGFNGRFVSDTLKVISDEKILMQFNTSISPCLVRPVEGDSYEYLILPVRLSSGNI